MAHSQQFCSLATVWLLLDDTLNAHRINTASGGKVTIDDEYIRIRKELTAKHFILYVHASMEVGENCIQPQPGQVVTMTENQTSYLLNTGLMFMLHLTCSLQNFANFILK